MSLNYIEKQIKEISDNVLLYWQTKSSKPHQKQKEREEHHESKIFDFNYNIN